MKVRKHILPLLLAFAFLVTSFSGCETRGGSSGASGSSGPSKSSSSKGAAKDGTVGSITPDFLEYIAEKKEENPDTVGWLQVPGTFIDDVVLFYPGDRNKFYMRRNFEKEYDFNGVYYADYRSVFGDGSREQLGVNTCIYGHAMTDVEEKETYNIRFGPLHDFREPEYAKEMPYIAFSTEKENMLFEVFAVFTVNSDNADIPYNKEPDDPKAFVRMIEEEILPRSKYDYGVKLKETDKFLTLSTCIYTLDNGVQTGYPDTFIRYAIMARLVDPKEKLKEKAEFTINENVIIDKDGKLS